MMKAGISENLSRTHFTPVLHRVLDLSTRKKPALTQIRIDKNEEITEVLWTKLIVRGRVFMGTPAR